MNNEERRIKEVEYLLYTRQGCSPEEAVVILNICLRNARGKIYDLKFSDGRMRPSKFHKEIEDENDKNVEDE